MCVTAWRLITNPSFITHKILKIPINPNPLNLIHHSMSSSSSDVFLKQKREVKTHEVAVAELNTIPSSRAVYQKNGNIFFRSTIEKATALEQKQLDAAKAKLQKMS